MSQPYSSQGSELSFPDLSQGTLNHILGSVGMESDGNVLTSYQYECSDEEEEEDVLDQETPMSSSMSVSMRRAVFSTHSGGDQQLPTWGDSQSFNGGHPVNCNGGQLPVVTSSYDESPTPHLRPGSLPFSPLCQPSSSGLLDDSPVVNSLCLHPTTLTPPTPISPASVTSVLSYGGAMEASVPGCSSAIPSNIAFAGEYGFKLVDFESAETRFKNSNVIYSPVTQRAYIKKGVSIPFYFTVTGTPPADCIIRAMCIHSAPENIADNLVCCPKHHDQNQKKGLLQPSYFVRPAENDQKSSFWRDHECSRLSIITPFRSLQKTCECYTGLYMFPCHTSDFSKTGQLVQVLFTLECEGHVLGRAVLDIRVCASPGRDRDSDHGKKRRSSSRQDESTSPQQIPTALQNGSRKRANPALVEVTKCTVPPKKTCLGLSRKKVRYTIETYPEVIPYIDVCVQMMERVQGVTPIGAADAPSLQKQPSASAAPSQPSFDTLESWLEHLGLLRHRKILQEHGITDTAQVLTVTEEELKTWGMKTQVHRKKFMEGKDLIRPHEPSVEENNSPPLFTTDTQSPPPAATRHVTTQSIEVYEFTCVKKSLSSSSSTSSNNPSFL